MLKSDSSSSLHCVNLFIGMFSVTSSVVGFDDVGISVGLGAIEGLAEGPAEGLAEGLVEGFFMGDFVNNKDQNTWSLIRTSIFVS